MGTDTLGQYTLFDIEEVIIEEGEEVQECRTCKKIKPLKSFHVKTPLKNNAGILDRRCNDCNTIKSREQTVRRNAMAKPPDDYRCPICRKNKEELSNHTIVVDEFTYKKLVRKFRKIWVVDHDHVTGEIRGIICNGCNIRNGQFEDNIDQMERAKQWLKGELNDSTGI